MPHEIFWMISHTLTKLFAFILGRETHSSLRHFIGYYCCRLVTLVWTVDGADQMASVRATLSALFAPYANRQRYRNRSLHAHRWADRAFAVDSIAHKRLDITLTPGTAPKMHHSLCSPFVTWPDGGSLYKWNTKSHKQLVNCAKNMAKKPFLNYE